MWCFWSRKKNKREVLSNRILQSDRSSKYLNSWHFFTWGRQPKTLSNSYNISLWGKIIWILCKLYGPTYLKRKRALNGICIYKEAVKKRDAKKRRYLWVYFISNKILKKIHLEVLYTFLHHPTKNLKHLLTKTGYQEHHRNPTNGQMRTSPTFMWKTEQLLSFLQSALLSEIEA